MIETALLNLHISTHAYMYKYIHSDRYVYVYEYIYIYYIYMYIYIYVFIYIYMFICTHIHAVCIYIYICTHTHTCCIYIYIYKSIHIQIQIQIHTSSFGKIKDVHQSLPHEAREAATKAAAASGEQKSKGRPCEEQQVSTDVNRCVPMGEKHCYGCDTLCVSCSLNSGW